MKWYKVKLTEEEVIGGEVHKIMKIFYDILKAFSREKPINEIVIFEAVEQGFHVIYFSPASKNVPVIIDLINIYSGKTCEQPFKGNVRYVAGDAYFATRFL